MLPTVDLKVVPVSKKIRIPTLRGPTPLIFAILCEQTEIVKYLIERKKARMDIAVDGLLPIHFACIVGLKSIVEMILDKAPEQINSKNALGYTPLHIACSNEHLQIVLMLIKRGAAVNCIAHNGNTPLHVAMRNSDTRIAEVLIAADDNVVDVRNRPPQNAYAHDLAGLFNNDKMVKFMKSILSCEVEVPIFEVLYVKYSEDIDNKELMLDVVDMLSRKMDPFDGEEESN